MVSLIQEASGRIFPYVWHTPLVRSEPLSRPGRGKVWLKLESLQPTGAFKVRPAFNAILTHLEQARRAGVVTSSSGNFAQATAYAARELGVDAQIVMMRGASPFKIERTRQFGGDVVLCEDTFESRWETTFRIQRESGRLLLHPYDSEETIAGDGTIGLELLEDLESDFCVVVPVSGGGLVAGIAAAVKAFRPACRVIGVQPEANPSMAESKRQGSRVTVPALGSMADALSVLTPGELTFEIVRELVDDVVLVEEDEFAAAVRLLAEEQKLVAEPGGAAAVAAWMAGKVDNRGLDVVCIVSGGNIVPAKFAGLLQQADMAIAG
jgi:threonine dehydratase